MKILVINKFLFSKGGDAICSFSMGELLHEKNHTVEYWGMDHPSNREFLYRDYFMPFIDYDQSMSLTKKIKASLNIIYSFNAEKRLEKVIKLFKPNIVHLNNFSHQLSPSILRVIKKYDIPVVMTLHDYKLICPSYTMLSKGKSCEKCMGGRFYWCFFKKCTKNSHMKSLINMIEMYMHHKLMHIYDLVDVFIAPSRFMMNKTKTAGFKGKFEYLPNFVYLNDFVPKYESKNNIFCYFGRISAEKGLITLLNAFEGIDAKLKIIGNGPIKQNLEKYAREKEIKNVFFLGYKSGEELKEEISNSLATILPSEWYENNPRSVLEAFALGKPVIGSRIGGIPELVKENKTGLTFEPGNAVDLRGKILKLLDSPREIIQMGMNARRFIEESFYSENYYLKLIRIYKIVIKRHLRKNLEIV